jgi:hypothetical protein
MRKWSEAKQSRSRFLSGSNYSVGDVFRVIVSDVVEEEFEKKGARGGAVVEHVLTLTRPGIGHWGDLRVNVTNGDMLARLVGDDFTKAIGQQFDVKVVETDRGNGFRIGPVGYWDAKPVPASAGNGQAKGDDLGAILDDEIPRFDPPETPAAEPTARKRARPTKQP